MGAWITIIGLVITALDRFTVIVDKLRAWSDSLRVKKAKLEEDVYRASEEGD